MAHSAPHEALRSTPTHQLDGQQPPKQSGIIIWVIEGVYGPQSLPLFWHDASPQYIGVFWGSYTPTTPPKKISACPGGCCPSICCITTECKASCGVLGGHFCRRQPWSAMVVLVVVGRWRLMSDRPTVGIVKIVYGSSFLFLRRNHTFLTSDLEAKKRDLGESKMVF
jgi:hypothetical protein